MRLICLSFNDKAVKRLRELKLDLFTERVIHVRSILTLELTLRKLLRLAIGQVLTHLRGQISRC